ncbi:MAG: hypothetical protein ACT4OZ_10935 [Gemmatimonadota bacterium]
MKKGLHPLDVVLGLCLLRGREEKLRELADELGVAISQVHASLGRLRAAQLLRPDSRQVNRLTFAEFLIHGARYVFPPEVGPVTRGVRTAHAAPALAGQVDASDPYVWPSPDGDTIGQALAPLYKGAPALRERSPETYRLLTLFDALRVGQAREKNLAREQLRAAIGARRIAA